MSKFSQNNTVDEARAKEYLNIFFIKCRANEYIHKKDKKMNIILSFQNNIYSNYIPQLEVLFLKVPVSSN